MYDEEGTLINGTEIVQVYGSSQLMTTQQIANLAMANGGGGGSTQVVTSGSTISIAAGVGYVYINKTVGSPTTIHLPPNPTSTQVPITIKDAKGDANINSIIISTVDTTTIDGISSASVTYAYGSETIAWNGTGWSII